LPSLDPVEWQAESKAKPAMAKSRDLAIRIWFIFWVSILGSVILDGARPQELRWEDLR
ncbi:MAG: hypothetical protein JO333_09955, partial [Verrucomicrobia bacterium]|nr:hypothetical protein [Verrucomicrobiota bacterium]